MALAACGSVALAQTLPMVARATIGAAVVRHRTHISRYDGRPRRVFKNMLLLSEDETKCFFPSSVLQASLFELNHVSNNQL